MHEVGLAEAHASIQGQGVVGVSGTGRNVVGGSLGKFVGLPFDEGREDKRPVEVRRPGIRGAVRNGSLDAKRCSRGALVAADTQLKLLDLAVVVEVRKEFHQQRQTLLLNLPLDVDVRCQEYKLGAVATGLEGANAGIELPG